MATFAKEDLIEEVHETVYDRIVGSGRWSIHYERVFKHDDRFWMTTYRRGATECQDESPYEYEPDEVECVEVFPVERTVTVYEPAP